MTWMKCSQGTLRFESKQDRCRCCYVLCTVGKLWPGKYQSASRYCRFFFQAMAVAFLWVCLCVNLYSRWGKVLTLHIHTYTCAHTYKAHTQHTHAHTFIHTCVWAFVLAHPEPQITFTKSNTIIHNHIVYDFLDISSVFKSGKLNEEALSMNRSLNH